MEENSQSATSQNPSIFSAHLCPECCWLDQHLLATLPENALLAWQKIQKTITYPRREKIFTEGSAAENLYLLCEGRVKISRSHVSGNALTLRILQPGTFFGLQVFTNTVPRLRSCTAEALDNVKAHLISRDDLRGFLLQHPAFCFSLVEHLSEEMRRLQERLAVFGYGDGRERLASVLVELSVAQAKRTPAGLLLPSRLRRSDLAELTGLATETVMRLIGAMKNEGLLATMGRRLIITNISKLEEIAGH
ncbi:Crp/Fnr family transcriptional regulator [Geoalkalibacter sp.]|uniref:Crp/Fnr family transcriptional regulator n=1 Tax=Geoalkalibacter sp. TaxID=3041440 RepID=UPI00272E0895|nr:Crp/Fnr family transcriptional regulator [Geoalkalibacter sp.]